MRAAWLALALLAIPVHATAQTYVEDVTIEQLQTLSKWEWEARGGDAEAAVKLGLAYAEGRHGLVRNADTARAMFEHARTHGSSDGTFYLGVLASNGLGEPVDKAKAFRLWREAASRGHAGAHYNLGLNYDSGRHMPRDLDAALRHYDAAAKGGDAKAAYNAAAVRLTEFGAPREEAKAIAGLRQAAEAGLVEGLMTLAWAHEAGAGVPRDVTTAIDLYLQAEAKGDAGASEALDRLGTDAYAWGLKSFNAGTFEMSAKLFDIGCAAKHGESCYGSAWGHANGAGTPVDRTKAVAALYTSCVDAGFDAACQPHAANAYELRGGASAESNRAAHAHYADACASGDMESCLFQSVMEMHENWGVANYKAGHDRALKNCLTGGHRPTCDFILPVFNANRPPAKPRAKEPGWLGKILGETVKGLAMGVAAMGQVQVAPSGSYTSSPSNGDSWQRFNQRQSQRDWNEAINASRPTGPGGYAGTCRPGNPYC